MKHLKKKALKYIDQFLENIGLMRLSAHENFRDSCEEFAKDYLRSKSGLTVGGLPATIDGGIFRAAPAVIGSQVVLRASTFEKGMVVAPWVRNAHISECRFVSPPDSPSGRSAVEIYSTTYPHGMNAILKGDPHQYRQEEAER